MMIFELDKKRLEAYQSFQFHELNIILSIISVGSLSVTVLICLCCPHQKKTVIDRDDAPLSITATTANPTQSNNKIYSNGNGSLSNGIAIRHLTLKEKQAQWWLPQLLHEMRQFSVKKESNSAASKPLNYNENGKTPHCYENCDNTAGVNVILRQDSRSSRKLPPLPDGNRHEDNRLSNSGSLPHNSLIRSSQHQSTIDPPHCDYEDTEDHYDHLPAQLTTQPQFYRLRYEPGSKSGLVNASYCQVCIHRTTHQHDVDDYDDVTSEIDPIYSAIRRRVEICDECGCEVRSVLSSHMSTPNSSFRAVPHGFGVPANKLMARLKSATYSDAVMSPWRQLRHQPYPANAKSSGLSTPNSQLYSRIYRQPGTRTNDRNTKDFSPCPVAGSLSSLSGAAQCKAPSQRLNEGPCSPVTIAGDTVSSWSLLGAQPRPELPRRAYGNSEVEIVEKLRKEDRKGRSHSVDRDTRIPHPSCMERSSSEKFHPPHYTPGHRFREIFHSRRSGSEKKSPPMKPTGSYASISAYCVSHSQPPNSGQQTNAPIKFTETENSNANDNSSHDNPAFVCNDEERCLSYSEHQDKRLNARKKLALNLNGLRRNIIYDDVYNSYVDISNEGSIKKPSILLEMGLFRHMDSDDKHLHVDLSDKRSTSYKLMTPLMEQSVEGSYFDEWSSTNKSGSSVTCRSQSGSKSTLSRSYAADQLKSAEDQQRTETDDHRYQTHSVRRKSNASLNSHNKHGSSCGDSRRSKSINNVFGNTEKNGTELVSSSESSSSKESSLEELRYLVDDQSARSPISNYRSNKQRATTTSKSQSTVFDHGYSARTLSLADAGIIQLRRKHLVTTDSMRQIQYLDLSNFSLNHMETGSALNRDFNNLLSPHHAHQSLHSSKLRCTSQPAIRFSTLI